MSQLLFDYLNQYMELTSEEQQFITALDLFQQFSKNDILLKEGQYTSSGYFVLKGCIRCYYLVDGEEKTTAFYTELESLEPPCVVSKKPSAYYVACVEDSIILVSNDAIQKTPSKNFLALNHFVAFFRNSSWLKTSHPSITSKPLRRKNVTCTFKTPGQT